MVAAGGVAMAMVKAMVVILIHLGEMEQEVARTRFTSNVSNAINMDTMPIGVQMPRSRTRHIMFVQRRARSHCILQKVLF